MTQACCATVCFVEDSDIDFEMATRAIERLDHQVAVARATTFDELRQHLDLPDLRLVVIDINLPRENGFTVLKRLRRLGVRDSLGVVVFSTSTRPQDRLDALESGAADYHEKPTEASDFLDAVTSLVSPWVVDGGAASRLTL